MSTFRLFIIFTAIFVAITSCDYSPTGSNYQNINPNFIPTVMNIELPEDGKTIMIQSGEHYSMGYNLKGDLTKFYKVVFYIDTNQIFESTSTKGYVNLYKISDQIAEEHILKMVVLNHSGTGSLADKLGMEGTYTEKTWKLIVYNYSNYSADSAYYTIENGILKLNWKKYPYDNFLRYEITKKIIKGFNTQKVGLEIIPNKDSVSFFDKSYVGEKVSYQIDIKLTSNSSPNSISFPEILLDSDLPNITINKIDLSSIEINWTKNKFYNNIKRFRFTSPNLFSGTIYAESKNQSLLIKDLPLGSNESLQVAIVPMDSTKSPLATLGLQVTTGDSSFKYSEFETKNGDLIYYSQNTNWYDFKFYKYSISRNLILDSTSFRTPTSRDNRVVISPSGKNIVYRSGNNLAFCLNGDLKNPKIITDVKLKGSKSSEGFSYQAISDNGILVGCMEGIYVYDVINDKMICTMLTEFPTELGISSDGDYIAYTIGNTSLSKIVKIENGSASIIYEGFRGASFLFDNIVNSKLYYYDVGSKSTKTVDCNTKVITNLAGSFLNYIDLESGLAIRNPSKELYEILDLNNGLQQIFSYKSKNGSGYIKGDYIYFSTGFKCKFR